MIKIKLKKIKHIDDFTNFHLSDDGHVYDYTVTCDGYEIIEEDKKIEKLDNFRSASVSPHHKIDMLTSKLNELINSHNKLMDIVNKPKGQ